MMKIHLGKIFESFTAIFNATLYILKNPKIWVYILLPLIINIVFSTLFFRLTIFKLNEFVGNWEWVVQYEFLGTILSVFGWIVVILVTILIFLLIGMIISSPFNGVIVEKILDESGIKKLDDYSGIKLVGFEIYRASKFEIIKIFLIVLMFALTSILNLIPVVGNMLFIIVNYTFNSFLCVLDLQDASLSRLDYSFKNKSKFIIKNWDLNVVFGLISSIFLTIPFFNFLFLPVASIAATQLFIKSQKK